MRDEEEKGNQYLIINRSGEAGEKNVCIMCVCVSDDNQPEAQARYR